MESHIKNINKIAILGALALFLSLIEHIIPKPIPFVRLGIANLPILLSLVILKPRDSITLLFIKSIGSSMITGTIFSWLFIYSLVGSVSSGIFMVILYTFTKKHISMVGVGIVGALISNITQISIAMLFLGSGAKYLGVPIIITGLFTGTLLGFFTNNFINKSKWLKENILS